MKKPERLSDKKFNKIYEDWKGWNTASDLASYMIEAELDDCYYKMLEQFKDFLKKHGNQAQVELFESQL